MNNRLSKAEASITTLEKAIKAIDVDMELNYDQTVAKPGFFESYQAKKDKLDQLMSEWETLTASIEKLG